MRCNEECVLAEGGVYGSCSSMSVYLLVYLHIYIHTHVWHHRPSARPGTTIHPHIRNYRSSNTTTYAHTICLPTPAQLGVVARFSLQEEALVLGNFPRLTCSRIAHHRAPLPPSPQRDSLLLQRPKSKSPAPSLDSYTEPQSRPAIACPVPPEFASGGSAPALRGTEHSSGGALQVGCIGHRISL